MKAEGKTMTTRVCAIFAILVFASGCSPKTLPANFYLLQPISPTEASVGTLESNFPYFVGVGPIDIPAYLDRPQIVTGGDGALLRLDEFQRWAEPLRDNFTRVLAENLALLMPASNALPFPWNRAIPPDYQVEAQITRFHVDRAKIAQLKANWSILKQNKLLLMREFQAKIPVEGGDDKADVAALSLAVASFSREIAQTLQSVRPQ